MAISPIGTPVNTHSATGSVTGTWGTGQVRNAGDLLAAIVTAAAATTVTATACSTAGWVKQQEFFNTATGPHVLVALWTKPAAGLDAVPVFTSTETGTAGGMDCMLFELQGASLSPPTDAIGFYSSGATAGTVTMTATTSTSVITGGEVAISVFAQEAAAAALTWTDTGAAGFTKLLNGNGVSAVLQTYIGILDNPPAAATLNDAGHFSTDTTAYGAGMVVTFLLATPAGAVLPVEAFTNNGAATVTTGGTDTPAAGTSEVWSSVNVTGAFPAAGGAYQFHVIDPLAPAEKILVTASPGGGGGTQSWTVTRGAEGTPVVTHLPGFAITQAVTAGVLAGLNPAGMLNVNAVGADPAGVADSTAAIQSAVTTIANAGVGGIVQLGPGNYRVNGNIVSNTSAPIYIQGAGAWATTIYYYGTGDCFRIYNSSSYQIGDFGGGITGMTIDGTSAGAGSSAVHMGDIFQYRVDITVQNFTLTGSKGVWFDNRYYWTEQLSARVYASNCTQNIVFDNSAGASASSTGSFMRGDFTFRVDQQTATSDGVVLQNGAFWADGTCVYGGNFNSSASALTSAAVRITGSNTGGWSHISNCRLDWGAECQPTVGTNYPYDIYFGSSTNYITSCYGYMDWAATAAFQACNIPGCIQFFGQVSGDAGIAGEVGLPGPCQFPGGIWLGNYAAPTTLTSGATVTTGRSYVAVMSAAAVTGLILAKTYDYDGQHMTIANVGNYPVTFAAVGTSNVSTGATCTITAGNAMTFWFAYSAGVWYPEPYGNWTAYLPAAFTAATGTAAQPVTGLVAVLATGSYEFRGYLPVNTATAAAAVTFAFTFTGTAGTPNLITWLPHGLAYAVPLTSATITTASPSLTCQLSGTPGYYMEVTGVITVTAPSTFQLTVTNGTGADAAVILAGAVITFTQVA